MIRFVFVIAFVVGAVWFFATHWPSSAPDPASLLPAQQSVHELCESDPDHTLISVKPDKTVEVYRCDG